MLMRPLVFADFHHSSLLWSLIMLFEKRLGGTVFTPIGREWHTEGFWKVFEHPDTITQYLSMDGAQPLEIGAILYGYQTGGFFNKAVTLEGFWKLPIDIVIASIPSHIEPFRQLCMQHGNHPKLIFQIGNEWDVDFNQTPNVMASALVKKSIPHSANLIHYHQEFDTSIFSPDFTYQKPNVYSFVNFFTPEHNADWPLFEEVEKRLPSWNFRSYGGGCRDGNLSTPNELAEKMRDSRFIWHTKPGGDGYGHNLYNSAASARPLLVKTEYYQGKMGRELMIDGKTCIAIDGLSPDEIVNKILYYSHPSRYAWLCKNVYRNFVRKVNFDREAESLKNFIASLI